MATYPLYPVSSPQVKLITSSNLSTGDFVIADKISGGVLRVKKAVIDPYNTYYGFVLSNYTAGQTANIQLLGSINNGLSGLTLGVTYYAHPTVPGSITSTIPTGTKVIQLLGKALNSYSLDTQYAKLIDGTGGGGGGGGTNSNVLIDGGTFVAPSDNTLIDAGIF